MLRNEQKRWSQDPNAEPPKREADCQIVSLLSTGVASWVVTVIASQRKLAANVHQAGLCVLHTVPVIRHFHRGRWCPTWGITSKETKAGAVTTQLELEEEIVQKKKKTASVQTLPGAIFSGQ